MLVPELMQRFGCSQRHALRVVKMSASTYLYKPVKKDESALKMRIKEITDTRVHYGYRRVHVLLRREGHADNVGAMETNQKLSEERAAAVGKALVERGVPEQRIRTAGFSSRRPVASNTTPDGRRLNRRVELVLLEEKVENLTKGEPVGAFASAWDQLKTLIDQGLVKPVEKQ